MKLFLLSTRFLCSPTIIVQAGGKDGLIFVWKKLNRESIKSTFAQVETQTRRLATKEILHFHLELVMLKSLSHAEVVLIFCFTFNKTIMKTNLVDFRTSKHHCQACSTHHYHIWFNGPFLLLLNSEAVWNFFWHIPHTSITHTFDLMTHFCFYLTIFAVCIFSPRDSANPKCESRQPLLFQLCLFTPRLTCAAQRLS